MTIDLFLEILLDSFIDTIKILPIIFLVYLLIEFIEARESEQGSFKKLLTKKSAPLFGALIGIIPQCGFSVVATRLYQKKYILLGTLIAVYFATSDEALPIMFSNAVQNPALWLNFILLIAIKLVYAIAVGFIINLVVKRIEPLNHKDEHAHEHTHKHGEHTHEDDEHEHEHDEHEHDIAAKGCCHHGIGDKRSTFKKLVLHPLLHSAKICLYIFIVTFAFGFIFNGLIGKEKVEAFLSATLFLQPLFTAVVGLIPNCASSVVIAQLYVDGALSLGGAITGLTLNSGLGVAVLLKDSKNVKKSLIILAVMLVLSLFIGYLVTAVSVLL